MQDMKNKIKMTKENKRFSSIIIIEFLEKIMKYGEIPSYVNFYRHCKFVEEKDNYFTYAYPETKDKDILYKLYCPQKFVKKALSIYNQHRNIFNDIEELYKMEGMDDE